MTVEQTTQLIQLVLNSVLISLVCGLFLHRLGSRHLALGDRLQMAGQQYAERFEGETELRGERLVSLRKSLRQLQRRHILTHYSVLTVQYGLFFSVASTLLLALRALVNLQWLIPASLALFVMAVVALLMGVGLALVELHSADRSLWEEVQSLLDLSRLEELPRIGLPVRPLGSNRVTRPSQGRSRPTPRARVS